MRVCDNIASLLIKIIIDENAHMAKQSKQSKQPERDNISLEMVKDNNEREPLLRTERQPKKNLITRFLEAAWEKTCFTSQRDPHGEGWQARLWVVCSRSPKQANHATSSLPAVSTLAGKTAWRIFWYFFIAYGLDIVKFFQTDGQSGFNLSEGSADESGLSSEWTTILVAASLIATTVITAFTRIREINRGVAELLIPDARSTNDKLPEKQLIAIEYERINTSWWKCAIYWGTRGGSFAFNLVTMAAKAWVGFLSGIIFAVLIKGYTPQQIASFKKGDTTYLPSQSDPVVWLFALAIAGIGFLNALFFDWLREGRAKRRTHDIAKWVSERRKKGYDIYWLRQLPLAKTCMAYIDTYLYEAKTKRLFFVLSDGSVKEINITDQEVLNTALLGLFGDKSRICLSPEQFANLITANGGVTPISSEQPNHSRKEEIVANAATFFGWDYAVSSIVYGYASFAMASTVNLLWLTHTHETTPDSVNWSIAASGFFPVLFSAGVDTKEMFEHFFSGKLPLNFKQTWSASFALLCCEFRCGVYQIIKNICMTASIAILAALAGIDTYNNEEAVSAAILGVLIDWGCADLPAKMIARIVAIFSMPGYFANNGWLALLVLFHAWGLIPGELHDANGITHVDTKKPQSVFTQQPSSMMSINTDHNNDESDHQKLGLLSDDTRPQGPSCCCL